MNYAHEEPPPQLDHAPLSEEPATLARAQGATSARETQETKTPLSIVERLGLTARRPAYLEAATRDAEALLRERYDPDHPQEASFMAICYDAAGEEYVYAFVAWLFAGLGAGPIREQAAGVGPVVYWMASDVSCLVRAPRFALCLRHRNSPTVLESAPVRGFAEEASYSVDAPQDVDMAVCPYSDRQLQILRLLAEGLTTNAVATRLHISVDTARTHRQHILSRSERANMIAVVVDCARRGWI